MAKPDQSPSPPEEWNTLVPGEGKMVRGRLTAIRSMKRSIFLDLRSRGYRIQVHLQRNSSIPELSCGDLLEVTGTMFTTHAGEVTLKGESLVIIAKWQASVAYSDSQRGRSGPLCAFGPDAFKKTYFPFRLRADARQFLVDQGCLEVQTPVLSKTFNGGRSYPVITSYLGKRIGFNRTTMEDRMLALIAAGYERIFEIGSIFRSDQERTFLEMYMLGTDPAEGLQLIKSLLAHLVSRLISEGIGIADSNVAKIIAGEWEQISFTEGLSELYGIHPVSMGEPQRLATELIRVGVIDSNRISPESLADTVARSIAIRATGPIIVDSFPEWSSPLYAVSSGAVHGAVLERGRMFLPNGLWGFEFGVQERDHERFVERVRRQRVEWNLPAGDDRLQPSSLELVLAGGLPPVFGFAMSIDRILWLWSDSHSIDPYG